MPSNIKMKRLTGELSEQFKKSVEFEKEIKHNLKGLGYEIYKENKRNNH